jgi:hypothetical protein
MILTDRTLFGATLHNDDVIHLVDVSDTSEDPAGSTFKLKLSQLKTFIENNIYTNDGTLVGSRVVTQAGFALNFVGGNVGIGITPSDTDTRLHSQGVDSTSFNFGLKVKNSASANLLCVRNDGKVGVGTDTPFSTFSVVSDTGITLGTIGGLASRYIQYVDPNGASPTFQEVFHQATNSALHWSVNNGAFGTDTMRLIQVGGVTRFSIGNTGSPLAKVHIKGSAGNGDTGLYILVDTATIGDNTGIIVSASNGANNYAIKSSGKLNALNIPTSLVGLVAGDIWSNAGVLTIV